MWPFECVGPDGQTYLHNDNWKEFVRQRDEEYPHNFCHRRALLALCLPSSSLEKIPGVTKDTTINFVEEGFTTIFQPYPAHLRTGRNPDGANSLHLFIEDGHRMPTLGESITLFSTGYYFFPMSNIIGVGKQEGFALFQGKYWRVWSATGGGYGTSKPPAVEKPKPKQKRPLTYRSIDDEWD